MKPVLKRYRELLAGDQVRAERDGQLMVFVDCTDVLHDYCMLYRFERLDGSLVHHYQHPFDRVLVIGVA